MWIVTPYFNFKNDERRFYNFIRFLKGLPEEAKLCLVELVLPNNKPVFDTFKEVHLHVSVTTDKAELWCKEALINIGIKSLPPSCDKVCWMDADVEIRRPDWYGDVARLLDTHPVVQPHSNFVFMEEDETPDKVYPIERQHKSFALEANRRAESGWRGRPINFIHYHPGHAWAARIDFLKSIEYLFPFCILGHGDIVMCTGFSGHYPTMRHLWKSKQGLDVYTKKWGTELKKAASRWQANVEDKMRKKTIGVLKDTILYHWYHGSNESRKYVERAELLKDYDPYRDTRLNEDGMIEWTDEADIALKSKISKYFSDRASAH
jgi:hypothetical protein